MNGYSGLPDIRGLDLPALTVYSIWAVSYCIVCGVEIVGTHDGRGRVGWRLDNADGKAKRALDEWRNGTAVVNGRALVDAHGRLMDFLKHEI